MAVFWDVEPEELSEEDRAAMIAILNRWAASKSLDTVIGFDVEIGRASVDLIVAHVREDNES